MKDFVKTFSATTATMILQFCTNIGYVLLYCVRENQHVHANLSLYITKACPYNVDLKPHFYIVKVGFTGVYISFLISAQNIDYGYSLEPPRRGGSNG